MRTMVLWLPDWPVVAARADEQVDPGAPFAVVDKGLVHATCATARRAGVRRGQRVRDAQARCPELTVTSYDPSLDVRAFEPVIARIESLVPGVATVRPGVCALRARGPARFYGGEQRAAQRLLEELAEGDFEGELPAFEAYAGVADGRFAAEQAARRAHPATRTRVVDPGGSAGFLAPLPVDALEMPELTDVLRRLGLRTLGDFAGLSPAHVYDRFGAAGAFAHRLAAGRDPREVHARIPPAELAVTVQLDPPAGRVDEVVFAVKTAVEGLVAELTARALVCTAAWIHVWTEAPAGRAAGSPGGREQVRRWAHPRWFGSIDLLDRLRWQLQGGAGSAPPGAGVAGGPGGAGAPILAVRIVPDQVESIAEHADGLWGGGSANDDRVHRSLARIQSLLGHGGVGSLVITGGRTPAQRQTIVPWGDPREPVQPPDLPWPGRLPPPAPTSVLPVPVAAIVLDQHGQSVEVSARGVVSAAPVRFGAGQVADTGRQSLGAVTAWAGPWPVEQRWWEVGQAQRAARFQLVGADGRAWLLALVGGRWWIEAGYD